MEILNQVLINLYFLVPLITVFYIFRKLNFQGMRREWAFDISISYLFLLFVFLKLIYFFQNYQNYSSIGEIVYNLNLPEDKISFIFLFNFLIALIYSRISSFSVFKILDTLTLNFLFIIISFNVFSQEISLILFLAFATYFLEKRFNSGFISFLTVFIFTNYFILNPIEPNSLIFYAILNTINALLIYRRIKYMSHAISKEFIAQCKEKLLHRKQKLLEELKVIDADIDEDRDTGNAEYLDEVQEDMKVEKNYIFKKEVNQMLEAVDAAIKRIDDGTYGIDKKTGEPIDPARLELFPEADENVK
jgi:DnaK suppressor protein